MADVRCPMCSKPNPAEAEVCQYCQARLKPLIAPQGGSEPRSPQPPQPPAGGMDWLNDLRSDEGGGLASAPSEGEDLTSNDLSDWLSRLGQVEETPETEETPPAEVASKPDWLSTPMEKGDPNIPDWMEDLGISAGLESGASGDAAAGETPAWLKRVRERQQLEQQQPEAPQKPEEESPFAGLPDWSAPAPEGPAPTQESGLPDWLANLGDQQPPPSATEEEPSLFFPGDEIPPAEKPTPEAEGEASLPDWFSQYRQPDREQAAPSEAAEPELPDVGAEPLPDWLTGEQEQPVSPFVHPDEGKETVPDWLSKLGPAAEEPPSAAKTSAFLLDDEAEKAFLFGEPLPPGVEAAPDWLAQVTPEEAAPQPAAAEEAPAEEELSPAQLPSWLEAMRPVEAAALPVFKDEKDTHVEGAGPLSGLRGVLRAEPEVAHLRKPPVYTVKMQLSEAHQARLNLLDDLLKAEGQAKAVTPRTLVSAQPILRIVIAVLLTVVVFWQLLASEKQDVPLLLDVPPQEVMAVYGYINGLTPGSPVLVAFDYEPAFSGELDISAGAILAHLKDEGAFLAVVSTSPTGSALAERLLASTAITSTQMTNFGYLPGGQTGLAGFAQEPKRVLPFSLGSLLQEATAQGWSHPALAPMQSLADFDLVIVFTDDPDTGRGWIEQVGPTLQGTPLLMVASAQAAPLLRPYYPQQIQGLIGGFEGAAAYQGKRGIPAAPWKHWDAYSGGLLAAVLLLLAGGLVNLFSAVWARSKGKVEE